MFVQELIQAMKEDQPAIKEVCSRSGHRFLQTTIRGVNISIDKEVPMFFNYYFTIDDHELNDISKSECAKLSAYMKELMNIQARENNNILVQATRAKLRQKAI